MIIMVDLIHAFFNEVTETGASLIELKQVIGSKVDSSAAIIYDMENRWAMEDAKGPRNEGLFLP